MEILYSDSKIAVCVKPCGVLSTDEEGGLPSLLRAELGGNAYTVHRLDAAVGGLMVLARTRHAASTLGTAVQNGEFEKNYLAVVRGIPEECGTLCDWLIRDRQTRMTRVTAEPGADAREAVLDYQRLGTQEGLSLLSIRLHTGRTHQIRCQFSSRGWPLWGDRKYGTGEAGNIALWSCRLRFAHPVTGETLEFRLTPPESAPWDQFSKELESWKQS